MTDDASLPTDRRWLLEPPGANDIHLHVEVGSEADLSDTAREVLERLLVDLQGAEVSGFADSCVTFLSRCKPYSCTLDKCQPLSSNPCFIDADCRIADVRRFG